MKNLKVFALFIVLIISSNLYSQESNIFIIQMTYEPRGFEIKKISNENEVSIMKYKYDEVDYLIILKNEIQKLMNLGYKMFHSSTFSDRRIAPGATTSETFMFILETN